MPPATLDSIVQVPWNLLTSFSRSALSSAHAPVAPDAVSPTAKNSATREIRRMVHLTRIEVEREALSSGSHYFIWAIWMRLPQVSSKTADRTGPMSTGG